MLVQPPAIIFPITFPIYELYIYSTSLNDSRLCIFSRNILCNHNRRTVIVSMTESLVHFRLVHQLDSSLRKARLVESEAHRRILFRDVLNKWSAFLETVIDPACFVVSRLRVATKPFVVDEDWHSSRKSEAEFRQDAVVGDCFVSIYN